MNLHQALIACSETLISHGGHRQAAGLKLDRNQLETFRAAFCEYAASEISDSDRVAEIAIDAEAPFTQLTLRTMQEIEQLAPFGEGNPRPVLCATGVSLSEPPRKIGNGERHLSLKLNQYGVGMRAVAFGWGEAADESAGVQGDLDIAFKPVINDFGGRRSVEMHLVDWRPSRTKVATSR